MRDVMSRPPGFSRSRSAFAGLLIGSLLSFACGSNETADPAATGGTPSGGGSGGAAGSAFISGGGGSSAGGFAGTGATSGGAGANASGGASGAGSGGAAAGAGAGGEQPAGAGGRAGGGGEAFGGLGGTSAGAGGALGGAGGASAGASGTASAGLGGGGTAGGAGAATGPFVCNQATGGKLMDELFIAGFEAALDGSRWQLKWKDHAAIEEWANAQSTFWDAPIESACTNGSNSPDRVIFMIFSWTVTAQADWRAKITQAVNNFRNKYAGLRRIDFMGQIRGPNNMLCPTPPASGETIVVSPELQAAMQEVAAAFPGFVFLSPAWEARSCSDFDGGGPHLTTAGNQAAAGPIAAHFAATQ